MTGDEDWPEALNPFCAAWGLVPERVLSRSPWALVAHVRRGGEALVLKLADPETDEVRGADLLAHFGGCGAVRLVARDGPASLIECAEPGTVLAALVAAGRDEEATRILCGVAQALHAAPAVAVPCPTVEDLGRGFARFRTHRRRGDLDPARVAQAAADYAALAAGQGPRVVLHGDLHHENILWDAERGWLAIDPKGVTGEPAFETAAALRNPIRTGTPCAEPAVMARRVDIMAGMLGLDRARILGWCAAQAVLAAIWSIEDGLGRRERLDHWLAVEACARGLIRDA